MCQNIGCDNSLPPRNQQTKRTTLERDAGSFYFFLQRKIYCIVIFFCGPLRKHVDVVLFCFLSRLKYCTIFCFHSSNIVSQRLILVNPGTYLLILLA